MTPTVPRHAAIALLAAAALPLAASAVAQPQELPRSDLTVYRQADAPAAAPMGPGPVIRGFIAARNGDRMKVTAADGTATVIAVNDATRITAASGLFGSKRSNLTSRDLLNGLPVTVKTVQSADGLIASQVTFRNADFKTAAMIRNGTSQQFEAQTAATEALRGRMGDIDKYTFKATTNVTFATGKWTLTPDAKATLCQTATTAGSNENALILVVGYTDSVGDDDFNQTLSEKRAASVRNYLQQACHWKPYRMMTPTGMAKADPLADNSTPEGKAQNRRVSVNVLVSKALDTGS